MATLPWGAILSASLPTLIEQASRLFTKADEVQAEHDGIGGEGNTPDQIAALSLRIDGVESMGADQAKLLKDTLEELQKVSVLAAGLQARANIAVFASTVAVAAVIFIWFVK